MAIKSFAHKGVEDVFCNGRSRKIGAEYLKRMRVILDALQGATGVMDLEGAYGFHALHGNRAGFYAMSVSGNWRLVFRFEHGETGDVMEVDFIDYH